MFDSTSYPRNKLPGGIFAVSPMDPRPVSLLSREHQRSIAADVEAASLRRRPAPSHQCKKILIPPSHPTAPVGRRPHPVRPRPRPRPHHTTPAQQKLPGSDPSLPSLIHLLHAIDQITRPRPRANRASERSRQGHGPRPVYSPCPHRHRERIRVVYILSDRGAALFRPNGTEKKKGVRISFHGRGANE